MAKLLSGTQVFGNLIVNSNVTTTGGGLYTTTGLFWAGNNNVISTGGGGSSPVGLTGQVQYNNGGSLGAAQLFYYTGNSSIVANAGTASTTTTTGTFQVVGGLGVTGNIYLAGNIFSNNTIASSVTSVLTHGTDANFQLSAQNGPANNATGAETARLGINYAGTGWDTFTQYIRGASAQTGSMTMWASNTAVVTVQSGSVVPTANNTINLGSPTTYWGTAFAGQLTANTTVLNAGTANAAVITGNIYCAGSLLPFTSNATYNIGSTSSWWGTFYGISTQAKYADLAENYLADKKYEPGTVVVFGGDKEITTTIISHDPSVAGVISTNPAYLMNGELENGLPVAFTGRVPCLVQGPVVKGDVLVTSQTPGVAEKIDNSKFTPGCVLGKSLGTIDTTDIRLIEVVVGRF